jgi:tetratricopeptide (TPR) repeat protein
MAAACAGLLGAAACRPGPGGTPAATARALDGAVLNPPPRPGLRTVAVPDFSAMEPSVASQLRRAYDTLAAQIDRGARDLAAIGTSYGDLGMLLMAASHIDAAEACFLNAQTLAGSDHRWPYYLGHLYKGTSTGSSIASFERAMQLRPDDPATLVWLGDAYLADGRPDAAAPLFEKALRLTPASAAAHFGSGRVALDRKDYAAAAAHLEQALALDPQATASHYQLGMAYRGLGDMAKAGAQLAQRGDIEPRPADPLMRRLDELLESAEAYNVRGGRELDAQNWAAAAEDFRKGLALKPDDPSLRHRLGTALYQMKDAHGAEAQFRDVIRRSPDFARAHFSLGLVLAAAGRHQEAIDAFSNAVKSDGGYLQARLQLASLLARNGRPDDAIAEYRQVLERDPAQRDAAFGLAMALVRLERYRDARARLDDALKARPGDTLFSYAQARLLAAAPDPKVRNGARAMALVTQLLEREKSLDVGATLAMALAEVGDFAQAGAVQRDVIAAAESAGLRDALPRMRENLRLYEQRQPCRTPFTNDELP